ncbi:hypothetical protein GCM10010270_78140 [Streptomyces violaceus]|nr:hypothetical protein GCM10010270_78140 [Streptomyces janthinus]
MTWRPTTRSGASSPQNGPGPSEVCPGGYRYTVTVDDRTVEFADPDGSDALEELIERVLREDE